jgi:hypothetical protein
LEHGCARAWALVAPLLRRAAGRQRREWRCRGARARVLTATTRTSFAPTRRRTLACAAVSASNVDLKLETNSISLGGYKASTKTVNNAE